MPYLAQLGTRWSDGRVDVAQEHFASNLIRGRLAALALGWGDGVGPRAVLACPKGELHDLPLMVFGIALNRCGWRITFLGNNTPVTDLENAVRHLRPEVVVLAATTPAPVHPAAAGASPGSGATAPVVLGGAGATPEAVPARCVRPPRRPGHRGAAPSRASSAQPAVRAMKVLVAGASGFVGRRLVPGARSRPATRCGP